MYLIDDLLNNQKYIDNMWVILRPENYKYRSIKQKIKEAWAIFKGNAEAIKFYKQ